MSHAGLKSRFALAVMLPLIMLAMIAVVRPGGGRVHSAVARPDVFTVTNLNDSGEGSLRDAIEQANATAGTDTLIFQDELSGTITLTSGELFITDDLNIIGPGVFSIVVSGNHASRVFEILSSITVSISSLTISDGQSFTGGAIFNGSFATLNLDNVVLSNNAVTLSVGGALFNSQNSTMTINNSTLSGNSASGGGGIYNSGGAVTITNSTLSGNSAGGGGGVLNSSGTLTMINSTVSGNSAVNSGGGIANTGSAANLSFVTVAANSAASGGGVVNGAASVMNIKNSIVAINTSGGDCANMGTFNATGVNFTTNGTCPGFTQVTAAQLNLGPLADNGGPTRTHALLVGSVAIDAANDCTDLSKNPVGTDQRGIPRPQGNACDAGAYEFVPCNQQPVIFCSEDFTVSTDSNQCAAVVDFTPPTSDCPCNGGGIGKPSPPKGVAVKPTAPKEGATCTVACSPASGS